MRRLISRIASLLPQRVKTLLVGKPEAPNRLANFVHGILNRTPGGRFVILPCEKPLKGYRMRIDWQKHRSFIYGTWEPEVVHVLLQNVSPGMVALDIGAHGGYFTLLLSKLVGPSGRVIAFEPLPANVRVLEENLRLNDAKNVQAVGKAMGEHSGEFELSVPAEDSTLVAGELSAEEKGTMRVACDSLDDFFEKAGSRVDFIKMDVEGAESGILRGAGKTIKRDKPTMLVELHDIDRYKDEHPALKQLRDLKYDIEWVGARKYNGHVLAKKM